MTTPDRDPVTGSPDDLRSVLDAFENRTVAVEGLAGVVGSLVGEVRDLRRAVQYRPSRKYVDSKRRIALIGVLLFSILLVFAHDQHVEVCGPGARSERIVDAFLGGETDPKILAKLSKPTSPFVCDVFFPLHTHHTSPWPNSASAIGLTGYIVSFGGLFYWASRPSPLARQIEQVEHIEQMGDQKRHDGL